MFPALPAIDLSWFFRRFARIMHKFSTAATKSSTLTALRLVGLLNVPYSTFAGASVARGAAHSGRRFRRFVTRTYA